MKVIEAIKTRRSIRTFLDTPITADQIIPLLESAMYAPSAHNEQPWQFLIIEDPQLLEKVSKIHEYVKMVETAPIGVLVCGDMKKDIANLTSVEKVGCSSVRDKVFRCDVVVTGGNAITGEGKSTASLLLMKTKEGWAEVEQ
jgi:nitroreductase